MLYPEHNCVKGFELTRLINRTSGYDDRSRVRGAKKLIKTGPRPVEQLDLAKDRKFYLDYLEEVRFRQNIDWKKADTGVPVIFGRDEQGRIFPIDGRHRLKKALDDGLSSLPIVYLTPEETESIRSGIRI